MARKTQFQLVWGTGKDVPGVKIEIVGSKPEHSPYVSISAFSGPIFIKDNDLERFAVNILKALGSKKLAFSERYKAKTFFRKKLK